MNEETKKLLQQLLAEAQRSETWKRGIEDLKRSCENLVQPLLNGRNDEQEWNKLLTGRIPGGPSLGALMVWPREGREPWTTFARIARKYGSESQLKREVYRTFRNEFFEHSGRRIATVFNRLVGLMFPKQFLQVPKETEMHTIYQGLFVNSFAENRTLDQYAQDDDQCRWYDENTMVMNALHEAFGNSCDEYELGNLGWKLAQHFKQYTPNKGDQTVSTNESTKHSAEKISPRSRNLIFFGAPGTGKSHKLNAEVKAFGNRYERVTFYPTYSYAQFVGCYKPVMKPKVGGAPGEEAKTDAGSASNISIEELAQKLKQAYDAAANAEPGQTAAVLLFAEQYIDALNAQGKSAAKSVVEKAGLPVTAYTAWLAAGIRAAAFKVKQSAETDDEEVSYKFVPGPFLRLLVKALNDPAQDYCLVIEEINRANAAAVFGDVFQLLDRTTQDSNDGNVKKGESEYDIAASEDIKKFLKKNGIESDKLRIPANMYIWATMNSADQGVFPMDTAFKRRWAFKYIGIDDDVTDDCKKWTVEGSGFLWNAVRTFLNDRLTDNGVNEDKLMGPWFVKPENGTVVSLDQFRSKVLMYLWEDAARMCRRKFFNDEIKTYSALVNGWPNVNVFKGIENWDEVKTKWIPSGPGAGMDGAGAPEGTAEPQTEAMPAATSTRTETPPSE